MPRAKKTPEIKKVQPETPLPPPPQEPSNDKVVVASPKPNLPIIYPELKHVECSTATKQGPVTPAMWKKMLKWETEKEYQVRMVNEKGGKSEHWLFGDVYHCLDTSGTKVRCWNNANNRPFDMDWCEHLIHSHLYGQWAGPFTMPGETINCETIRVSRYAEVLSGQHTGTACILADETLQKLRAKDRETADHKYPIWKDQPYVFTETLVSTGVSSDERVLRTIDYVKPRTVADMLFTMALFRQNTPTERKEMTRILAVAIDTLWERTQALGYKTHPEVVGFLERHKRLLKCAEHIFVENCADSDRRISKLRIQLGMAAALCYLMGSGTDETTSYSDDYRNEMPPSERKLDWGYWDRAREFWHQIGVHDDMRPVRAKLNKLVLSSPMSEDNQGLGGRYNEKMAVLAKAWQVYKDHPEDAGPPFNDDDLEEGGALWLSYTNLGPPSIRNNPAESSGGDPLPEGEIRLLDEADFYGIDCPRTNKKASTTTRQERPDPASPPPTTEDIYGPGGLADQARARREEQQDKRSKR